jgi:hypothetical protein
LNFAASSRNSKLEVLKRTSQELVMTSFDQSVDSFCFAFPPPNQKQGQKQANKQASKQAMVKVICRKLSLILCQLFVVDQAE